MHKDRCDLADRLQVGARFFMVEDHAKEPERRDRIEQLPVWRLSKAIFE